jgi:hypothetical protein
MNRFLGTVFGTIMVFGLTGAARADEQAMATIDKGIKALGGEEKLSKVKAALWKGKGTISFGGMDNNFTMQATVQGLDHYKGEFEGEFGGNKIKGATVLSGDKGWRKFGDMAMEMDKDAVANEKRAIYLQVISATLVPLKDKGFKVESAGEEKVGDKPAVAVKVTPPDGKEFKLLFDKDSGLPVKFVAKVVGFMGDEFTQETILTDYKDFGGIKKATKIESKRDGEKFMTQEIADFKVLDNVDPKTFEQPKD